MLIQRKRGPNTTGSIALRCVLSFDFTHLPTPKCKPQQCRVEFANELTRLRWCRHIDGIFVLDETVCPIDTFGFTFLSAQIRVEK